MTYPHIHAVLARERQETLLAEARAAHRAREARAYRRSQRERLPRSRPERSPRSRRAQSPRRSPFRRAAGWLAPAWRRLLTRRPAGAEAAGQRVALRGDAAPAGRDIGAVGAGPAAAEHTGLAASPR